jgi:hypothetical protein
MIATNIKGIKSFLINAEFINSEFISEVQYLFFSNPKIEKPADPNDSELAKQLAGLKLVHFKIITFRRLPF